MWRGLRPWQRSRGWVPGSASCLDCPTAKSSRGPRGLVLARQLAQLAFGGLQDLALRDRQARARGVDIKGKASPSDLESRNAFLVGRHGYTSAPAHLLRNRPLKMRALLFHRAGSVVQRVLAPTAARGPRGLHQRMPDRRRARLRDAGPLLL